MSAHIFTVFFTALKQQLKILCIYYSGLQINTKDTPAKFTHLKAPGSH